MQPKNNTLYIVLIIITSLIPAFLYWLMFLFNPNIFAGMGMLFIIMFILTPLLILGVLACFWFIYQNRKPLSAIFLLPYIVVSLALLTLPFWFGQVVELFIPPQPESAESVENRMRYEQEERQATINITQSNELAEQVYHRLEKDVVGEHAIVKASVNHITLDTGRSYYLNHDAVIRKTASIEETETFQEISSGNFKGKKYMFYLESLKSFQDNHRDKESLERMINNYETTSFTLPIPKRIQYN